ncbi:hypothetical protein BAUCODRAFT_38746 [Baudoinia panamericana UAMH 10762]|uniref:Uncharacterized protein n=1 Tax=Baudoinia panamericana (strain UAMH 10762) TaxID=717646 RepID=M2MZ88_BAUPA|nr:uncharacterized protein BAUCODRAFT_38746 [Baudoinia panamericana UAMH 10762]EMC91640.1 hypothetical protein BAUCODRAFT_38746 [Baudoinia panamericana UAMH 10762]
MSSFRIVKFIAYSYAQWSDARCAILLVVRNIALYDQARVVAAMFVTTVPLPLSHSCSK